MKRNVNITLDSIVLIIISSRAVSRVLARTLIEREGGRERDKKRKRERVYIFAIFPREI